MRLLCPFCGLDYIEESALSCARCNISAEEMVAQSLHGVVGVPVPQTSSQRGLFGLGKRAEPSEPTQIQQWFLYARRSVGLEQLRALFDDAAPRGMYNTEGGSVVASTCRFQECEECAGAWNFYVADSCSACGRGPDNSVCTASGDGDGVYPVWATDDGSIVSSFIRWGGDSFPTLDHAIMAMHDSAPVHIATLRSEGAWRVGEDFWVPVPVPPGDYDVTVWIGNLPTSSDGNLHPVAITVVPTGSDIRRASQRGMSDHGLVAGQIAAAVWGNPAMNVVSHIQPMHEFAAVVSADFVSGTNTDLQVAWLLHQAKRFPGTHVSQELMEFAQASDAESALVRARSAMLIDRPREALEDLLLAASLGSAIARVLLPRWESANGAGRDPYLVWGLQDAFESDNRGWRAVEVDFDLGMDNFCAAAFGGQANSVSSFTWRSLMRGECAEGIALYEATRSHCEDMVARIREASRNAASSDEREHYDQLAQSLEYQMANSSSNAALLRLAISGDVYPALSEWNANQASGHLESIFYPALVMARSGDAQAVSRAKQTLTRSQLESLRSDFDEAIAQSRPDTWARAWFTDARDALRSDGAWTPAAIPQATVSPEAPPQSSAGRFCGNCGTARQVEQRFCVNCGQAL